MSRDDPTRPWQEALYIGDSGPRFIDVRRLDGGRTGWETRSEGSCMSWELCFVCRPDRPCAGFHTKKVRIAQHNMIHDIHEE